MSTLNETALEFARECLGWRDAKALYSNPEAGDPRFVVMSASARQDTLFTATDLKDVKEAAQGWCDAHAMSYSLRTEPGEEIATAEVSRVVRPGEYSKLSSVTDPSPCMALLAACVQAARKTRTSGSK